MLMRKKLGAPSAKSERALAGIVSFANRAVVAGHITLMLIAVLTAMLDALRTDSLLGIALSLLALVAVVSTTISALGAVCFRLTYTIPPKSA